MDFKLYNISVGVNSSIDITKETINIFQKKKRYEGTLTIHLFPCAQSKIKIVGRVLLDVN